MLPRSKNFLYFLHSRSVTRKYCSHAKKVACSYSFMPGDTILCHSTLGQLVEQSASEVGDNIAFIVPHQGIRKSYMEFQNDVNKLASGLMALGLRKGDRIGLCAPNIYEWPVTQFATAKAGLILVNINPAYQANELKYCLTKVGCKALITSETYKTQNFYEMLCSFLPELPSSSSGHLQSNELKSLQSIILLSEKARSGTLTFNEVMNAGGTESNKLLNQTEELVQFDDPVNIQFTSGTTGSPKGATLSHHNIVNNALMSGKRLGYLSNKPIVCCQVPLYHCFGCVLGTLGSVLMQHTCVLPAPNVDAKASINSIEQESCTVIYGTPTMFVDFLQQYEPHNNLSSLKQVVIGGAFCPENVITDIRDKLGITYIHNAYGSTENSPAVTINFLDDKFSTIVSSHVPPLEYVELKIVDEQRHVVPTGTDGEICTRGHILFLGYWEDDKKTNEVVDQSCWYYTGDIGNMDENGYITIKGRIKDMVIRGGENIFPKEIENFLHTHPSILEAHICGVPDERMGEELCAWIKIKSDETLSEQDIKSYCKGKIAHFKIPRYILFVDDFPKTVSGKIQKFKVRETSMNKLSLKV